MAQSEMNERWTEAMTTASLPVMLHSGSAALAMTQWHADASAQVSLGQKRALAELLVPGQSRYARDAIRNYLKIAAMNDRVLQVQ